MNNYFVKFVFLVAVVGAVLFSRTAYPTTYSSNTPETGSANVEGLNKKVPLFILPPVAVSAGGDGMSVATTTVSNNAIPKLHAAVSLVADQRAALFYLVPQ